MCPKDYHVPIQKSSIRKKKQRKNKEKNIKKLESQFGTNDESEKQNSGDLKLTRPTSGEGILQCHFCKNNFQSRSDLYGHYSSHHYKTELLKTVGETKTCPVCKMVKKNCNQLIIHVGRVHNYVEQFLLLQ